MHLLYTAERSSGLKGKLSVQTEFLSGNATMQKVTVIVHILKNAKFVVRIWPIIPWGSGGPNSNLEYWVLSREGMGTTLTIFRMTQLGIEPTTYEYQGEHYQSKNDNYRHQTKSSKCTHANSPSYSSSSSSWSSQSRLALTALLTQPWFHWRQPPSCVPVPATFIIDHDEILSVCTTTPGCGMPQRSLGHLLAPVGGIM